LREEGNVRTENLGLLYEKKEVFTSSFSHLLRLVEKVRKYFRNETEPMYIPNFDER